MTYEDILSPKALDLSRSVFVENAFQAAECDRIIEFAARLPRKEGDIIGARTLPGVRRSQVSWIPQGPQASVLYERMQQLVKKVNDECYAFRLTGFSEPVQYAEYPAGSGYYDWHLDIGKDVSASRKLSVVIQLTDPSEYEGGGLQLLIRNTPAVMPSGRGTAIFFPSFLLHRVAPVTKGLRRSLTLWVSGPPFA